MKTIVDLIKEYLKQYPESDYQINQGASLLLIQDDKIMFTLTKLKKWRKKNDITEIKFSGIGGALEKNESIFECLKRETMEEIEIDINDIKFPKISETFIVDNDRPLNKIELDIDAKEKTPLYVVRLKLPLREDTVEKNKKFSCLQLIVYVAKINSNIEVRISEDESIPGLLIVKGKSLKEVLEGKVILDNTQKNDNIEIKWNKNFEKENIPKIINLIPQFTPIGLRKTNLSFNEIKKLLEGQT